MFNFDTIRQYAMKFLKPSLYMGGLDFVLSIWREADAKERGILILVFAPMFVCMGGFIFTIIYFVLFVLPSYLFSFLGWGILTALFGAGGKYCYNYFTGKEIKSGDKNVIDVEFTEAAKTESASAKSTRRKSNAK
ncbi:MAG: hypothetical protein IJQ75_04775 [Synergistaceae bacterium]|nr:hypothetical protein [Synergistaceae bacterium]